MAKFPWFRMFPADWLSSQTVQLLTLTEEGAFFRLLLHMWLSNACALPKQERQLKRLCKWDDCDDDFKDVLACFCQHPELPHCLTNARLYTEWQHAQAEAMMKANRAKAGAEARWGKTPNHTEMPTEVKAVLNKIGKGMPS